MQSENNYIEAKDILDATNGGLDIIFDLYPQAVGADLDRKKKFKLREEKSASANLYKSKDDDSWLVTDFGDGKKPRNAIGCWMEERNVDFVTALRELAAKYNINGAGGNLPLIRAEYSERPATTDEDDNKWFWDIRESFTDFEIEAIISKNVLKKLGWKSADESKAKNAYSTIAAKFKYYRWHPLKSYSLVKNRKYMTFSATDEYPIFLIDEGSHQKLYQPKHPDKGKRFMYSGEKPKHFMHGFEQLEREYQVKLEAQEDEDYDAEDSGDKKKKKDYKLDEAILCSGGSDAINVALLGYQVLWLNSETAELPGWQYGKLNMKVENLYQLQDIDATGKASAHKLAMEYLDIFTIELPAELTQKRDARRNPCKDVRDYLNHWNDFDFKRLVETALPYRFWDKRPQYEGRGDKQVFVGYKYLYNNVQANNFLMKNGFGRMWTNEKASEWVYIKRTGNQVKEVNSDIIQDYLHDFLESRYFDIELRNALQQSGRLNDSSLKRLKLIEIDFADFTPTSQLFFFLNKTVEVKPEGIFYHKPGVIDKYIWEEDMLKGRVEPPKEAPFIITKDDLGNYDIEIKNHECVFLKYLVQVSRIHWRHEFEHGEAIKAMKPVDQDEYRKKYRCAIDGPNLSQEQIEEQKMHLINKLFTIGWHLHRYKDPTKGWFSYAMDSKMSEDGKSHGGSGKSIMNNWALRAMMPKNFVVNGRNPKVTDSEHKYEGVTEHTRFLLIDDCHEYFKIETLFNDVTGDLEVNPKGVSKFSIPFSKSPKIALATNYTARNNDAGSITRRILYWVFSDWYHDKGENDDYLERRDPKTDLGLTLFMDFTAEQWNHFYHTMLYALQFYLTTDTKIGPAMNNVNMRNLLSTMGGNFHEWAKAYFSEEAGRLDKYFVREEAAHTFNLVNKGNITPQSFKSRLEAFCKYYGYIFNPTPLRGKQGNIIAKVEPKIFRNSTVTWETVPGAPKEAKEVFFIQTRDDLPPDPMAGWPVVPEELGF